jgi:DNA-binding GntR family transcriptional regulator
MELNYKSLKELVYEYLYSRINSGKLKPNEKIFENQICKDLNVSRTPIREAMIQLENEGFLERLPRRGFKVKEINLEKIKEIYEIIGALEGMAANRAIGKIEEEDIKSMKNLTNKMDEAIGKKSRHEYFKLQRVFHDTLIAASGNKELFDLITSLKKRFIKKAYFQHENEDVLYDTLRGNNKQHKQIIKLIEEQDRKGVEKFLREVHWDMARANIVVSSFESSQTEA